MKILSSWSGKNNIIERLWLLAKIEFKLRYYENKLGLLWALIKPLSDILIYYVAFEVILKQGIPQFVSFLFIGIILWNFFVESTLGTIQILKVKKYLYEYTNMNKLEIYISTIMSNCIGFFFNFLMFVVYFLFLEEGSTGLSLNILYIIPIFFNLVLFSLAISIILSNIYIVAKDISQVWTVVVGIGFWLSPILFKLTDFQRAIPKMLWINPISGIVINTRNVVLYEKLPDWSTFFFDYIYAIVLLFVGLILLNNLGAKASEKL
ncbi:MAG: ABC transporter permease [Bacteroidetes bacterium]|nr:ABC transporter permease [Bacteroidota bacterium]